MFPVLLLVGCGGTAKAPTPTDVPTETPAPLSETAQPPTAEPPLAGAGPHEVGVQTLTFVDGNREDKTLVTEIWYPAAMREGTGLRDAVGARQMRDAEPLARDAEPDASDAPYPLILYSHGFGGAGRLSQAPLLIHLAAHGFVAASVDHACDRQPTCVVDRPMDLLFVLDQLAGYDEGLLEGMIHTDHVGAMGLSAGAYTTFQLAGAQVDPDHFLDWYAEESAAGRAPMSSEAAYWGMDFPEAWDAIEAYRGQFDDLEKGDLWPPITDERIQAALPAIPVNTRMLGERGTTAVTMPTLIIAATADGHLSYEEEVVPFYMQLGTEDRYMLSLINYTHFAHETPAGEMYYKHFSTAFFGYYLQGREDYGEYLTADYVESIDTDDLVWGVYEGK
jgi:predicted dienelactone hydrolase